MSNLVYPTLPGLMFPIRKAIQWKSQRVLAVSGREVTGTYQQYPIWEFGLQYEFLRDGALGTEADTLMAFLLSIGMGNQNFLYTDNTDSSVTAQPIGVGTGIATQFQLIRTMAGGGFGFVEPVNNVSSIAGIYLNGVLTTAYTISSSGLVTFTSAPAAGVAITWSGSYYYRVRITDDSAAFALFAQNFWQQDGIKFHGSVVNLV